MRTPTPLLHPAGHSHIFLGPGHERNEHKTWAVIWLCGIMMLAEIIGGNLFGSLALVADGMHMSTHAGALFIAALAYTYSRRHAQDPRFVFGTGKLGDLAGFTSAIVLAMIALLIGYEAVVRLLSPVKIDFSEAIPIAVVGLAVNLLSAWLLSGDDHHGHDHGHSHGSHGQDIHGHGITHLHEDETQAIQTTLGRVDVEIFEDGVPPHFRLYFTGSQTVADARQISIETERPDGQRQRFTFVNHGIYLESTEEIPEPHIFKARVRLHQDVYPLVYTEHDHNNHAPHHSDGHDDSKGRTPTTVAHRDNNLRAAYMHVIADAAVSVLAITGLSLASYFGWVWMDPAAGIMGALVIANWSYGLMRDTGGILLDMNPDTRLAEKVRKTIEKDGDQLVDLHLWRLGPGHLGAIISVITKTSHDPAFYRAQLNHFKALSHITVEVQPATTI
ncbi:MAG: CDF family Co(II)/Ni(II) efflux transporter DmeF [Sulfuriferula sp.]